MITSCQSRFVVTAQHGIRNRVFVFEKNPVSVRLAEQLRFAAPFGISEFPTGDRMGIIRAGVAPRQTKPPPNGDPGDGAGRGAISIINLV